MANDGTVPIRFGLVNSKPQLFSMIRRDRWMIPGRPGAHEIRITRSLRITVDGAVIGSMPKFDLGVFATQSKQLQIDGHEVVVYTEMAPSGSGPGARTLIYCNLYLDGRSMLDGSSVGVLAERTAAADNGPVAQRRRRFYSPFGLGAVITVGEAAGLAREPGFPAGLVVLVIGNALAFAAGARFWRLASTSGAGSMRQRWLVVTAVGCFVALIVVLAVAASIAVRA